MYLRLGRIARDDSGVAMLTVLGVIVVVTVLAVGSFVIARQALNDSVRVENDTKAFRAALSGLDKEMATFSETSLSETYPKSGSTGDGNYVVDVVDLGGSQYRLVSVGTASDGTTETVAQQFYFMNLWKMNFAGTGPQSLVSGAEKVTGSSNIVGPFYMKGDLKIAASMMVAEGPMFIRGGDCIYLQGVFGLEDAPVDLFCDGDTTALEEEAAKTTGTAKVVLGNLSRSVPDITLPALLDDDLAYYAAVAIAESVDNNMGSVSRGTTESVETATWQPTEYVTMLEPGYTRSQADTTNPSYKFIGAADNTIAAAGEGTHGLYISAATPDFGCWGPTNSAGVILPGDTSGVYDTNVHDDFAWDASEGILYVEGTVFVDGPLTIDPDVDYVGNGTIVVNGPVVVNGLFRAAGTSAQAQANEWVVGLVSPTTIEFTASTAQVMGGSTPSPEELRSRTPDVGGAFFSSQTISLSEKLLVQGSVITGKILCGNNNLWLVTNPYLPEYLPESLPGSGGGMMMPGLWTRY